MRTAADADGRLLAREVDVGFDTGAYADNGPRVTATGGRRRARAVSLGRDPRRRRLRLHEHRAVRLVPRVRRVARPVGRRAPGGRGRPAVRPRPAGDPATRTCCARGEEVRPGGKPLDADLVGDVEKAAAALGWDEPKPAGTGRGLSVGLLAAGAHPVSSAIVRLEADGEAVVLVGSTELGQGQRTAFAQIAARGRWACRPSGCAARHRHPLHALRPLDRREPLDDARRARRPAGRGRRSRRRLARDRGARLAGPVRADRARDGAAWCGDGVADLRRAHRQALRLSRRPAHRRGRGPPAGHRLVRRGARLLGGLHRGRGGRAWTGHRARHALTRTATVADVGKAINPQLVERQDEGATMQGIGNALFEEMLFARRAAAQRRPARIPRAHARRPSRELHLCHRRERRRAGAVRGQGLRRGSLRGRHRRDRDRASRTRACR